jgi:hypothetical protein
MGESDGQELVQVAYVGDLAEAEMVRGLLETRGIASLPQPVGINGPMLGFGLLNPGGGSQRVMVRAEQAREAQAVLAEALAEGGEEAWPEIANAEHLADAGGRKPRNYGLVGAYARIYLWSIIAMGVAFGVFLLLRAL